MSAYTKETEKPYGYVLIDNQPKATTDKQVVAGVFGTCHCYPNMITSTKTLPEETLCTPETVSQKRSIDKPEVKSKRPKQPEKKQVTSTKRKVKGKLVKGKRTQMQKKQLKPSVYKPKFIVTPT